MITFEPHPSMPDRTVARSERGAHLALIIPRENGQWYEVKPFVRWITAEVLPSATDAREYISRCAENSLINPHK